MRSASPSFAAQMAVTTPFSPIRRQVRPFTAPAILPTGAILGKRSRFFSSEEENEIVVKKKESVVIDLTVDTPSPPPAYPRAPSTSSEPESESESESEEEPATKKRRVLYKYKPSEKIRHLLARVARKIHQDLRKEAKKVEYVYPLDHPSQECLDLEIDIRKFLGITNIRVQPRYYLGEDIDLFYGEKDVTCSPSPSTSPSASPSPTTPASDDDVEYEVLGGRIGSVAGENEHLAAAFSDLEEEEPEDLEEFEAVEAEADSEANPSSNTVPEEEASDAEEDLEEVSEEEEVEEAIKEEIKAEVDEVDEVVEVVEFMEEEEEKSDDEVFEVSAEDFETAINKN